MKKLKKIISIISKETGVAKENISISNDFVQALHLNMFEEAILYLELEKQLHVFFPEDKMPQLRTVREIQKFVGDC